MTARTLIADVTLREHGQTVSLAALPRFTIAHRVATAHALIAAGVRRLELGSCISPRIAPAMDEPLIRAVAGGVGRPAGVTLITLVPNLRGLESFLRLGLGPDGQGHHVGVFFSAVESHNQANLGRSIEQSRAEIAAVAAAAHRAGAPLVGYVSGAFGYREAPGGPLETPAPDDVARYVDGLLGLGAVTVTVSDLQGVASPEQTADLLAHLLRRSDRDLLGYHGHHPDPVAGLALARAAYAAGIRLFDGSLGATGGCITGAPGNLPTEGLAERLADLGADTGLDLAVLRRAAIDFHAPL